MASDLLSLLDPVALATLRAESLARSTPTSYASSPGPISATPGQLELPAAGPRGYLGSFVTAPGFPAVHVEATANAVVIDAVDLFAPTIAVGGHRTFGLYRRLALEAMTELPTFPTGGVPVSSRTFASALAGPLPTPDGTLVLGPGWQRRDALGWWVPQGSGFTLVGELGLDVAFGVDFHEVPAR